MQSVGRLSHVLPEGKGPAEHLVQLPTFPVEETEAQKEAGTSPAWAVSKAQGLEQNPRLPVRKKPVVLSL